MCQWSLGLRYVLLYLLPIRSGEEISGEFCERQCLGRNNPDAEVRVSEQHRSPFQRCRSKAMSLERASAEVTVYCTMVLQTSLVARWWALARPPTFQACWDSIMNESICPHALRDLLWIRHGDWVLPATMPWMMGCERCKFWSRPAIKIYPQA